MIRVARRRLTVAVPVLFATTAGMFLLGAASPMDPAMQYAGAAARRTRSSRCRCSGWRSVR
jgi:peptide/nickel transport system permease protein